jgi:hypothetical protein
MAKWTAAQRAKFKRTMQEKHGKVKVTSVPAEATAAPRRMLVQRSLAELHFDEQALENLAIAIMQLRTDDGLAVALYPEDCLQPWLAKHFPKRISIISA